MIADSLHAPTLADVLRQHRRSHPDGLAAVDGEVRLTWPALDDRVNRLSNHLVGDVGVQPGDRILWLGQNSVRLLEGLLAAAKIGAIFCPVNWRQSPDELAFVIDDVEPAVTVWQRVEVGERIGGARQLTKGGGTWIRHDAEAGDSEGYEGRLAAAPSTDPDPSGATVEPASPVLMMYTAAFTGRPNGALFAHTALVAQGLVMAMVQEIGSGYVYLNCGPLFHMATFMTTLATFVSGGTNVFMPRVDAEELCRIIEAERCTGAFLMPPTMAEMMELNANGRYDLKSLRTFGGEAAWNDMITVDTSPWARRPAGYGQTEVVGLVTLNAWGGVQQGTSGRPHPFTQVRIVAPDGDEVAAGETGEIVARGPTVMLGYWNRPDLNAERLAGGWHHTGDLGRIEADGSLTFIAPKGRLIKSSAENIYPAEVEQCLAKHPAVAEAAVIGVPDPTWGQSVKAIVVRRAGATASGDELIEHCRSHVASYKKPKSVVFVDALPRQGWAVDYDALDDRFGGGGYPGSGR
jgi:long-chain acyl-CoA synthetase